MSSATAATTNWKIPLDRIKKQKCALILGPDLATSSTGKTHQEALADFLNTNSSLDSALTSEELFPFSNAQPALRLEAQMEVQQFFEQLAYDELYTQLAEIPFHLIISLSPDSLMYQGLEISGRDFQYGYYRKGMNPSNIPEPPSQDKPLLYQMLGRFEEEDSLILTYNDLFKYIKGIFGNYSLPEQLQLSVNSCNYFIFLGVQYEKWYLKLLLQLLDLHEQEKLIDACHNPQLQREMEGFYTNYLSIKFVQSDVHQFISGLHKAWKDQQGQKESRVDEQLEDKIAARIRSGAIDQAFDLLSRMDASQHKDVLCKQMSQGEDDRLWLVLSEKLIVNNKLKSALELMSWVAEGDQDKNMVISLLSSLTGLSSKVMEMSPEEFQRQMIRTKNSVLELRTTLKDNTPCE